MQCPYKSGQVGEGSIHSTYGWPRGEEGALREGFLEEDESGVKGITERRDFARELSLVRERAGHTVREVARATGIPDSTVGGYFSGAHLPSRKTLVDVLGACGVDDPDAVEEWVQALVRIRRSPGRRPISAPVPYRGLASFQPEDADWFHGRDGLVRLLRERVAVLAENGGGALAVVGASGSGKSSLLRAGLIPALINDGYELVTELDHVGRGLVREPGRDGHGLNPAPSDGGRRVALLTPGERPGERLPEGWGEGGGRVLVVDQFEEIFTECRDEGERRRFVAALIGETESTGAQRAGVVVFALRADFYPQALRHPALARVLQDSQVLVGPMSRDEVREAIVKPARQAKGDVEDGLVELVLRDLSPATSDPAASAHDAGALPLLSHALLTVWRDGGRRRLTVAGYQASGGIHGAVAQSAEAAYAALDEPGRALARRLFLRLVRVPGDASGDLPGTRRPLPWSDLREHEHAAQLERIVGAFVALRLLTAGAEAVEITHEALLWCWPRLRGWIDADRAWLLTAQQLEEAADLWEGENRDPAALYRGTRLSAARAWLESAAHHPVSPRVRDFVTVSGRRERGRVRRLYQLIALLSVLVLVAAGTTVAAVRASETVGHQRDEALSGKAANEADALRATNPALAAQLALAAYRLAPTREARGSLLSSYTAPYAALLPGHTTAVYAVRLSPDGHTLASASMDGTVRLWDLTDPHRPAALAVLTGHTKGVTSAVFSADGRLLATGGDDRTVRLWDVADPRRPRALATLTGHTDVVRALALSSDGRTLATASYDRTARLWDITDPGHPTALAVLRGPRDGLSSTAFSPDGRFLVVAGAEPVVRLWRVTDPRHPVRLPDLRGNGDRVLCVAFSPDGRLLMTGGFDNTAHLWDATDLEHPRRLAALEGHTGGIIGAVFGADGHTLVTSGYDRTIRLWEVSDPRRAGVPVVLEGHSGTVYSVDLSGDGAVLVSGGFDETIRVWDLRRPVLGGHEGEVSAVAFSPDGRTLATGTYRSVRLWDVTAPDGVRPLATLTGHTDNVGALAFSPDGRTLATGSLDGTVRLWDVTAPAVPPTDPAAPRAAPTGLAVVRTDFAAPTASRTDPPASRAASNDSADPAAPRAAPTGLAVVRTDFAAPTASRTDPPASRAASNDSADPAAPRAAPADTAFPRTIPATPVASRDAAFANAASADAAPAVPRVVLTPKVGNVFAVAFDPGGGRLAATGEDGAVVLWDTADLGRAPVALTGHDSGVYALAFAPGGQVLATGGADHTVRLWDLTGARPPVTLAAHTNTVNGVAFSLDGRTMATAGADRTVRLWSTAAPEKGPTAVLGGHGDAVNEVAFGPDGRTLATAGADRAVLLWDLKVPGGPAPVATLTGHLGAVYSLTFDYRGLLATGGQDATARLWTTEIALAARRLCDLSPPPITRVEWEQHLPDIPPRDLCP
ncbi:nSTAND1 domain-containing NTPase [Streptosporangium saharense]|uniref:nSTAND1 domain-containing NTPase n=1 Tax=Streptosporangium saharense TaxID=1706840 RepID=UPI00341368ED